MAQSALLTSNGSSSFYSDLYADMVEWVQDVTFPTSPDTYSRMRVDPQCAAVLKSYTLPIRRAEWRLDPAGCRDEVVQRVADDLGVAILGTDPEPGPARRRGIRWADHIRLATSGSLTFGFQPFEREFDQSDGASAHLVGLHERMPVSITEIVLSKGGDLEGIRQVNSRDLLPRARLSWYVHDREGSAWQGQSALRHAFAPWMFKHEAWRVQSTSHRRFGMGIPYVEAPPGATPGQILEAQRLASAMRGGEQAGAGLPPGFKLALAGLQGSVPDGVEWINYLDQQISRGALAGLVDLGSTPNGSRALGATFLDNFMLALQADADSIAETATYEVVVPLVDVAFGEDEPAPRVVVSDVGTTYEVTAEAVQGLVACGAIEVDDDLEAYLRGIWKLPEKGTPRPKPQPPAPPVAPVPAGMVEPTTVPAAPGSTPPVAASTRAGGAVSAATGGFRREPTAVELAARTDFEKVQSSWASELDDVVAAWSKDVLPAQRAALVAQVEAAAEAEDLTLLAALTVDSSDAADLLEEHMADLADEASRQQTAEAKAQGITAKGTPDSSSIRAYAETIAALAAATLAGSAARKATQAWSTSAKPADVAATVGAHLESLTDSSVRDYAGAGLSTAQNEGRLAVLRDAPAGTYVASELLDASTCAPCQAIDGHQFDTLEEADLAYASGGYAECEGGLRCRGIVVTVWDEAAAAA